MFERNYPYYHHHCCLAVRHCVLELANRNTVLLLYHGTFESEKELQMSLYERLKCSKEQKM